MTGQPSVLSEREVASLVGVSVHTLRRWRKLRRGPIFCKIKGKDRPGHGPAGAVRYRRADVDKFLEEISVNTEN